MGYIGEDEPFPCGSVLKKFEGTIFHLNDLQIRPTKIHRENWFNSAWRCATFDGENVRTREPVTMILHVQSV